MTQSFAASADGTAEQAWAASWAPALPELPAPTPTDRFLVVAAHPDDETLGAGGLIATAGQIGASVTVVVATDGEASHPNSPTWTPQELAAVRRREVTAALATLNPTAKLCFLGLPDSQLSAHVAELAEQVRARAGECTHVVTPWSGDKHPDHAACARAGSQAASFAGVPHLQYPIWAWHWDDPDRSQLPRDQMRRLALTPAARSTKAAGLRCHVSQHSPLSAAPGDEEILSAAMLAHFLRDYEVFVEAALDATSAPYFDALYVVSADPWGLAERFYEQRKRDLLLASLPRRHFRRAFEPGCATGLLTAALAQRCDDVVAWDCVAAAIDQARERIAKVPADNVLLERRSIPLDWPGGEFDLIVISEVGYYCVDQAQLAAQVEQSLAADGVLLACHWRHHAAAHPVRAEQVHHELGRRLRRIVTHVEDDFLLDVWTRDGVSVAAAEGIIE